MSRRHSPKRRTTMATLYAEWCGEFGWLLLHYAPAIRHLSRSYDKTVFALDASWAHIVEDFAEVVPLKCQGHAQHTGQILEGELPEIKDDWTVARWKDVFTAGWKKTPPAKEHMEYGHPPKVLFNAVCFFRPPKPLSGGRGDPLRKSYPEDKAAKLVEMLVANGWRVACAGGPDNRTYDGATDIRSLPLDWLCPVLRGVGVVIGPSSGPMHLASLCGAPHVTWCDHSPIRRRYEKTWNPFETTCEYLKAPNPEPEEVAEAAERIRTR